MSTNQKEAEGPAKDTFDRDGEAAKESDRRAWFVPGSVADDPGLQLEEAKEGGILDAVTAYAARSVFDKDHRTFDGAKKVAKVAAAPVKGAAHVGRTAVQGVGLAARGAGAVAKGAANTGQAILKSAAQHKAGRAAGQGTRSKETPSPQVGEREQTKARQRSPRAKSRRDREPER